MGPKNLPVAVMEFYVRSLRCARDESKTCMLVKFFDGSNNDFSCFGNRFWNTKKLALVWQERKEWVGNHPLQMT